MSKYYCQKISLEHLNKHLAFFMFDGNRIHEKLLDAFIFHLKNIILGFMKWDDIKFMSSSLYFAYDAYDPSKYTINFIDFDKYQ
jgi:Fe-S-cluster formation regulator IscX/YfhJ